MNTLAMNRLVIGHESRVLLRTPAFAWMLAALVGAIVFAAWSGANTIARQHRGLVAATRYADDTLMKYRNGTAFNLGDSPIDTTNPGVAGHGVNTYAVLPPTGLSTMSVGQADLELRYLPVNMADFYNTDNEFSILKDGEMENPVNLKKGPFDVAFVIVFLLPILIITISYDLLSSEKERGTLAMVLAHPISLKRLIASKLLCRFGILLAVVVVVNVAAFLAVGSELSHMETWVRFGLWLGATVLYSLFWFAMATLVNARGGSSSTNGIALAAVWLVLVVVVPTLISLVATTLYPAPSRMDFITEQRSAQAKAELTYTSALDQFAYDHPGLVSSGKELMDNFVAVREAKNDAVVAAVRPLYEQFQSQLKEQEAVVTRFQFLSPAIMMQRVLNEAAGSSTERYSAFKLQTSTFQKQFKGYFMRRILAKQSMTDADYDQIPKFEYAAESLGTVMSRLAASVIGLVLMLAALMAVAFRALRRYPVAG